MKLQLFRWWMIETEFEIIIVGFTLGARRWTFGIPDADAAWETEKMRIFLYHIGSIQSILKEWIDLMQRFDHMSTDDRQMFMNENTSDLIRFDSIVSNGETTLSNRSMKASKSYFRKRRIQKTTVFTTWFDARQIEENRPISSGGIYIAIKYQRSSGYSLPSEFVSVSERVLERCLPVDWRVCRWSRNDDEMIETIHSASSTVVVFVGELRVVEIAKIFFIPILFV